MNVNQINHTIATAQGENQGLTEKVVMEDKRYRESQQSTSHKGVAIDRTELKSTVDKLNQFNDSERTNLKFVYHEDLHEYYVTVVHPVTNEVIREIPPKKMLDMFAAMTEYMGILVDEKI